MTTTKYNQLKQVVEGLSEDVSKFYDKGNGAAGTRIRKGLQEIKNLSQDFRKEISEIKNKED